MSNVQSFLDKYSDVLNSLTEKTASLNEVSENKKAELPSIPEPNYYNVGAGNVTGRGYNSATGLEADLRTMNPLQLQLKYGPDADRILRNTGAGFQEFREDYTATRNRREAISDNIESAILGFGNSILGLGTLGLGLANEELGVKAARALSEANQKAQSLQSEGLQARRRANAAIQDLSARDNKQTYEYEKGSIGEFNASLRRIGRDAIDTLGNIGDDPMLFGDTVASGIGSLFGGGAINATLKQTGRAVLGRAGATAIGSKVASLGSKVSMPAVIGGMEAGGAYQQTVDEAYAALADRTDLTEADKVRRANQAGLMAAAIQGPIGAATGTLVSKFEASPFSAPTVRSAVSNILKEAAEETIQSGSSQLATNFGVQAYADRNREITEGVGEQAALGVVGGYGAATLTQTPGLALRTTLDATKLAGRVAIRGTRATIDLTKAAAEIPGAIGKPIRDLLIARGDRIIEQNEKNSPVSDDVIRANFDAAITDAPVAEAVLKESINNVTASPEEKAEANSYVDNVMASTQFDPEILNDPQMPELVKSVLSGSNNKLDAINSLAELINLTDEKNENHLTAGVYLYDMLMEYENILNQDPVALAKLSKNDPANQVLDDYQAVLSRIQDSPKVARALRTINRMMAEAQEQGQIDIVSDAQAETPAGQQQMKNTIGVAEIAPEKANPEANDKILFHEEQGRITLNDAQRATLKASSALVRAQREYDAKAEAQGLRPEEFVTKQIISDLAPQDVIPELLLWRRRTERTEKSAAQHMQGTVAAYRSGNLELAAARLEDFLKFAEHMSNKVAALNEALATGKANAKDGVRYPALNAKRTWETSKTGLWVNPYAPGSVKQAQRIANEAETVSSIANSLVEIFPDLNMSHFTPVALDESLTGPADEVVERYRSGNEKVPQKAQKTDDIGNQTVEEMIEEDTPASEIIEEKTEQKIQEVEPEVKEEIETELVSEPEQEDTSDAEITSEPEAEVTEPAEPVQEAPVRKGMDAVYPDLFGSKTEGVTNWFKKAFRLPAVAKSRTVGTENPLTYVREVLQNSNTMISIVGNDVGRGFTPEIGKAYAAILQVGNQLSKELDKSLQAFVQKRGKDLFNGKMNRYANGKALNITEEDNGKISYNQELMESAILATIHWMINADQYGGNLDTEAVASLLNEDPDQLPEDMVTRANQGITLIEFKRNLAQKISSYWGLNSNPNAPLSYVEGIPEAIAAEMILALEATGQVKVDRIKYGERSLNIYIPEKLDETNPIYQFPDAIERVVLIEPEEVNYIGSPPKTVAQTQLRNRMVPNTDQQKEALEKEQAVPHYINIPMINFLTALGIDNILKIFGTANVDKLPLNANHRASLEGQNLTISSAFSSLQRVLSEARHKAEVDGVELDQLPIHYAYNFTRVNRMQMLGKNNPQASKLVREAILPTRSKLQDVNNFYLGLAQALGVKVHNKSLDQSINEVLSDLNGELAPLIQIMQDWLNNNRELTEEEVLQFADAGLEHVGLHAIMEYARYLNTENKSNFETAIYVEADGVTNGPINTMVLLTPGRFTSAWFKNVAKGGLFFGRPDKTMNVHRSRDDANDLYQASTDQLSKFINRMRTELVGNPANAQMNSLLQLMDLFIDDLNIVDGELELSRGIAKNPLTITIYGSGAKGIAGNITEALLSEIYARMSNVVQAQTQDKNADIGLALFGGPKEEADRKLAVFQKSMDDLTSKIAVTRKGQIVLQDVQSTKRGFNPEQFSFNKQKFENIQQNILTLFVGPLRDAISNTVGVELLGDGSATEILRKATQVQSIFASYSMQNLIARKLAEKEKDPGWIKDDFLSQKELDEIYQQVLKTNPMIQTGTQNLLVSGSKRVDIGAKEFGNALNDQLRTPANIQITSDAGVSGIPFVVISTGDGQMMQTLATMPNAPTGTLKVYDGMHLPLDQLQSGSQAANQAVWESWMTNPLSSVLGSYSEFMKDVTFKDMNEFQRAELIRALFDASMWNENISDKQIYEQMKNLQQTLNNMSVSVEARHNAMKRVNVSIDQMAAVGAPYQHKGEIDLSELADIEIEKELNRLYNEELVKLLDIKPVSEDISADLSKVGRVTKSGARILSFTAIRNLMRAMSIPVEQQEVLGDILRSLATKEYKVVFGTPEQVRAYADQYGKDLPTEEMLPNGEIKGFTAFNDKTIYLFNPNSETLIHELIHAATFDKVQAHYDGINTDTSVAGAIERMEGLMEQFLTLGSELAQVGPSLRDAYSNARAVIKNYLNNNQKAEAMNEFMAWGLSNSDLIRIEKKTEANVLSRIADTVIDALKSLIFGRKKVTKPANDLFSNLRFNTNIILRAQPTTGQVVKDVTLFQNVEFGTSERLTSIQKAFDKKIADYLNTDLGEQITRDGKLVDALQTGIRITRSMNAHGFPMTMQELSTFQMIVTGLATEAYIDVNALARAEELYSYVTKNITVDDFIPDNVLDPEVERFYAQEKYNSIMGNYLTEVDAQDRSTLLPAFLGLAIVNQDFRDVLAKMEVPKAQKNEANSVDNLLENFGNSMMDSLSRRMSGEGNQPNIKAAIDALSRQIVDVAQDRQSFIEQVSAPVGNMIDRANDLVIGFANDLSDRVTEKTKEIREKTNSKLIANVSSYVEFIASMVNEDKGSAVAEGVMSALNRGNAWPPFFDFINDLVGRTESNAGIYDLIKQVRSLVSQIRQQYREVLPSVIAKKFSRKIEDREYTAMFMGMAKTDLAGLRSGFSMEEILQIIQDPDVVDRHINDLETRLQELDPKNWNAIERKSKQLANYMVTGIPGSNLLRNAYAVSNLFGEAPKRKVTDQYVNAVDQLISLYAYEANSKNVKEVLSSLAQSEAEGVSFVLSYLVGQRKGELEHGSVNTPARENGYKGYIPSDAQTGVSLIIAEDNEEFTKLNERSFVRVGNYGGSNLERGAPSRGYYFAPVSGRAAYNQGILQNARSTAFGVDLMSGFTSGSMTAGRITDPETVDRIYRMARRERAKEPLLPIFDKNGQVVAYERSVDPEQLRRLNQNTNIAAMIGVWRGRQIEEAQAQFVNQRLIDRLHEMYLADLKESSSKKAEYIDLFDRRTLKEDPVLKDAANLITPETRAYIAQVFGDEFWVRRDMLNDALGYRSASIGDAWTENTRWSPETLQKIKRMAMGVFGNKAYQYLMNAESLIQNFVTDARVTIVVKSVIVPITNLTANVYQLAGRGVPLPNILKALPKKTAEIDAYAKSRAKQIDLEAELRAAEGDIVRSRKLAAEIQSITDSHRRMSIWPLIQAGEFSSISDAGVSRDEILMTEGKLSEYIERLTDKLPGPIQTAAKYAIVARDTALFQGLQKAVEYGDFLAKAVLYDDLTKRQGRTKEYALSRVTEEFVNYDRLPGRFRGYLESMGLLWFWNFKIRSTKIALSMIRNNPVHTFLTTLAPTPTVFGTVGLPTEDNIFSVLVDGRLDYSIGPGQGFRSFYLNPWYNLTN